MAPTLTRAVALVAAASILAGCAGGPSTREDTRSEVDRSVALYLTATSFTEEPPQADAPERVPSGNFFKAWSEGRGLPTWTGGPRDEALLVTNATVVVWAETPRGAAQGGRFPSYIAYFGTEDRLNAFHSLPPMGVVPPGDRRELVFPLALPAGGLVLEAASALSLLVTPVQTNDDSADAIEFLVNSAETPSRVELVGVRVDLPPRDPAPVGRTEEGRVVGSAYALGASQETTARRFAIELGAGASRLDVEMQVTRNAGVPDVDLSILDADGNVLGQSVTPYGVEGVRLFRENFGNVTGSRNVFAEVVNYGSAVAEFRLAIEVERA